MKKVELSLLYNAYPNIDEKRISDEKCNNFEELSDSFQIALIKERICRIYEENSIDNILDLDEITSKKLLISLYEYYLKEEMVEYTDFWSMDKEKNSKKEKIEEDFRSFLSSNDNIEYIQKFDEEIKNILKDNQLVKEVYVDRPTYFLLYRIRNNILKEVKKKVCSEKHFKNMIKDINKKYRELYVKQYNKEFFYKICEFEELKKEIFKHIEDELVDNIRNGKIVNVGNELASNFKHNIQKDEEYSKLIDKYMEEIKKNDGFEVMEEKYQEFQQKFSELSIKYLDDKTQINEKWIKEDLKTFILYSTAQYIIENNHNEIEDISRDMINEIEKHIINYIKTEYLKKEKYDVFVKVLNIELNQRDNLNISNITFIDGKELKSNISRYLKHESNDFEENFFKSKNEEKKEIFVKIEAIETYKRDSKYIEEIALEKVKDVINVIYFYNSREESKGYELSDRILIIENNTAYKSVTYSYKNGIFDLQLTSNEWLNNIFKEEKYEKLRIILDSINEYNKLNKDKERNNGWLIESNKKLLNEDSIYKCARDMSILIAGTNIFKYTVKYLNLRFWLIEDYLEFFNKKLPYDNFVMERFLNFYKRVINIIFSYADVKDDNLIKDLQKWILKIFPNNYIYKEDEKDEQT